MKSIIKPTLFAAAIAVFIINSAFAQFDKSKTPPPKKEEAKKNVVDLSKGGKPTEVATATENGKKLNESDFKNIKTTAKGLEFEAGAGQYVFEYDWK